MTKARYAVSAMVTVVLLLCASAPPGAWAARDKIINSFPAPNKYPSGLAYGGGVLYLGDTVTKTIYRLKPDTGSVMGSYIPSPKPAGMFMYGLGYASGYLWVCTGGPPTRLSKVEPSGGSVVASYVLSTVDDGNGIAADANYVYVANNNATAFYIYKFRPSTGSVVSSWAGAKYPSGLTIITHVPTSTRVLLNLGNVDGWVYIFDLDGTRHEGEQFKIDAPCPESYFTGDLACRDNTHIFYASDYLKTIFEHEINWGGQEEHPVAPTSFGKVKALFR